MKKQLSVLGCGWLGLPLAIHFIQQGWSVKGSTTSSEKIETLETQGIKAYNIELQEGGVNGDINGFVAGSELLIINIPPGLRRDPNSNFVSKLRKLMEAISGTSIRKLLYVSSTGVFKDHDSIPRYTEQYQFTASEVQSNQLIQAEQFLLNLEKVQTSVIRFGGLLGEDRHPVKYLSGKKDIKNPEAPVNLIHLDNCVLLISEIVQQDKFGMVFHGVEDVSISKENYYSTKAKDLHLPVPEFDFDTVSVGKTISMDWTRKELGITLTRKVL